MGENGSYGHAARRIATCVLGVAELNESPEEQKRMLRKKTLHYIKVYGAEIIPFLREEFQLALTDEELGLTK